MSSPDEARRHAVHIALEWGPQGLRRLEQVCDAVVIVDVLSFSTTVTVAVARGAAVWPHSGDDRAEELARAIGATLARGRNTREGRTLSPASMLDVVPAERLIVPSPNGSALSYASVASGLLVVAGCLRNASAVGRWLAARASAVGVVAAGEQWADHSLRVAYEDLVGAGAVVDAVRRHAGPTGVTPEAAAAAAVFAAREPLSLVESGHELIERGFAEDVALAEELDADPVVPVLRNGRYVAAED